jgi:translocation and assembly module TamA
MARRHCRREPRTIVSDIRLSRARQICAALYISLAALTASSARAATVAFGVEVEAPAEPRKLILENLSLIKQRGNDRVDEGQLRRLAREARREVAALLATDGYYAPEIDSTLDQQGDRWVVRITVSPGPLTKVKDVQLTFEGQVARAGPDEEPSATTLNSSWRLPAGSIFKQSDWEGAKRALVQQLLLVRYPLAALKDSRAEVNADTHEAVLHVTVDSGPAVMFGKLSVEGLLRYPEKIVVNLNPIEPGDVYKQERLLEFQRRLQDSGYFMRADVGAGVAGGAAEDPNAVPSADAAIAPVQVTLEENKLNQVSLGAGYSTNTGYRGQINYSRLSLFDTAVRMNTALILETKKQTGSVDFLFPVTTEGYRYSILTVLKREDVQNEITRNAGISGKRAWGPLEFERAFTVGYVRERKDVRDAGTEFSQALHANYGITLRRTDNLLSPSRGYLFSAQAGAAPLRLLTSTPFVRGLARYSGYFPVGESNTLILRAEGGAVGAKTRAGIPSDFLFRAGGDQSVRGYAYHSLGVKSGNAIVGGRYLATGSAEFIHWLKPSKPNWGVAAFVDAGNAADKPADLEPMLGYGVGGRWRSPVGVVNVDVAYGQQARQARLHFSLGVTF